MLKKALMGMAMILGDATEARALPQLAARFGAKIHEMHVHDKGLMTLDCRACHINPTGGGMRNAHGREFSIAGVYGAFHLRWLTLLGEWDRTIIETSTRTLGSAAYAELNVHVIRGIVARLKYDGYDPDQDVSDDELQRITFGLDVYPYPFTEVLIQYRRNLEDPAIDNDQFLVMLHIFF